LVENRRFFHTPRCYTYYSISGFTTTLLFTVTHYCLIYQIYTYRLLRKKPYWANWVCPDNPRNLQEAALNIQFSQNRLNDFGVVGVEQSNMLFPITSRDKTRVSFAGVI